MQKPPADRIVFLSIVIILLAANLLSQNRLLHATIVWLENPGLYPPTMLIGGLVGFTELVSRYRDAPWHVATMTPGLVFIGCNAAVSGLALFLFECFPDQLIPPDHTQAFSHSVKIVILAGTGAMVAVRTKIFTIRQPSGADVAVGPAFIVDTLLAAVNREVDRQRAELRMGKVTPHARELVQAGATYAATYDYIIATLSAFQNLDPDVNAKLRGDLAALKDDQKLINISNEVKFLIALYSILTEFGDRAFDAAFAGIKNYVPPPANGLPSGNPPAKPVKPNP